MKKWICLSHILNESTPSYGNRDHFYIRSNSSIEKGDTANTSSWYFSNNHIGTHIDCPYHFDKDGTKTFNINIDNYIFQNISLLNIPCTSPKLISQEDIIKAKNKISFDTELLLIKTGYENFRQENKYWNFNPGIDPETVVNGNGNIQGLEGGLIPGSATYGMNVQIKF